MKVTLGILAHVDAGKTTLSEQLLYRCGVLRRCGRVDDGDACLDFTPVERSRGITVFTAGASFSHGSNDYFLLDTPGHGDFSPEMERCLAAMDWAVLLISAAGGFDAHTERLWRLLEARGIPTAVFLNKCDLPGADGDAVLADVARRTGAPLWDLRRGLPEAAREQAALPDDGALEAYLSGTLDDGGLWDAAARAAGRRQLIPVFAGSALQGDGVAELLDGLDRLCRTAYDAAGPAELLVCQIRRDRQGGRMALCKLLSGTLRPRETVAGEKVHELRRLLGARWEPLAEAAAGEVVAVTGLSSLQAGDRAGSGPTQRPPRPVPPLRVQVCADAPPARLLEAFRQLEDEEPSLSLRWSESRRQLQLAASGPLQLEILAQTAAERFGLDVTFGEPEVAYQETIAAPVRGCGHFEPLRHYAEVHLLLEPAPRGSGVTFASRCPTDDLALRWQRLIETHVLEKAHTGALTGSPLTDVRVTLLAGRAHEKHTEGGDFRQAVYRAIRQALFHAENVLLEPWYRFEAEAEPAAAGRIQTDVVRMGGVCNPPEHRGTAVHLTGRCPVAAMLPYRRDFAQWSRGRAVLELAPDGFEPCRDTAAVVAATGYDRTQDADNPADSIFCSHGAGHAVPWDEAPARMHLSVD